MARPCGRKMPCFFATVLKSISDLAGCRRMNLVARSFRRNSRTVMSPAACTCK